MICIGVFNLIMTLPSLQEPDQYCLVYCYWLVHESSVTTVCGVPSMQSSLVGGDKLKLLKKDAREN